MVDITPENTARMLSQMRRLADQAEALGAVCVSSSAWSLEAAGTLTRLAKAAHDNEPTIEAMAARIAEVEADRDSWKDETTHWQDVAGSTLDRAEAAEADIDTLRACAREEMEKRERAEARVAELETAQGAVAVKTVGDERQAYSRVGHALEESSWHVHLAGFPSRSAAEAALRALALTTGEPT